MKAWWLLAALASLACSGGAEGGGEAAAALDACSEGQTSECTVDGVSGTRVCEIAAEGFAWGECKVTSGSDTCQKGDVMHCFAEGSLMRSQFGDLTASCQLVDGRWSYPAHACATPLVIAFDNQAVRFTHAPGAFDLFGEELSIGTDWVSSATPWLVLDRDHDGTIADGGELFGSMTRLPDGSRARNGFDALAALDANRDGRITPEDPAFSELALWADADQDRRSSFAELRAVAAARIEAIELSYRVTPRCTVSGCELERAQLTFRDETGALRHGSVIDVHLRGF